MTKQDEIKRDERGMIDMTPTWVGVLPIYLAALEDGTDDAKRAARSELTRMARMADELVAIGKAKETGG